MKRRTYHILLAVFFSAFIGALLFWALNSIVYTNNLGVKLLNEEKNGEAFEKFAEALSEAPFHRLLMYNLATSYQANKDCENAKRIYSSVIRSTDDPELLFLVNFNMGHCMVALKDTNAALSFFQEALEYKPESIETKTNIELLSQGGGGDGEGDSKNQSKQGKGKSKEGSDSNDSKNQQSQGQQPQQKQPQKYQGKELTPQDVEKIMEELKRQEQDVRGKYQKDGARDVPKAKDW